MYKSPINLINSISSETRRQIDEKMDNAIYNTVLKIGIHVDKDELLKALQYDRDQYNKGFHDGACFASANTIICKDCIHFYEHSIETRCTHAFGLKTPFANSWCNHGERKES